jgi:hypothetical protein
LDLIEKEIIDLFKCPRPEKVRVVSGALPIPFFGQYRHAIAATVSLNPSDKEFLDKNGKWLIGEQKRFESYNSLGCQVCEDLTGEMIQKAYLCCTEYFERQATAYWQWFRPIENVIKKATNGDVEYTNGKMAHFDLSPWATNPVWSGLNEGEQQILKKDGLMFLKWLLETSSVKILFLNGKTTCETIVKEIVGENVSWTRNTPSDKWGFYSKTIRLKEKEIRLIGWNLYLQQSGSSDSLIQKITVEM